MMLTETSPLIWFAGVGWDETMGTDRRIVEEISRHRTVVWIDPPNRNARPGWWSGVMPTVELIGGVVRLRVPATIGVTRWPFRIATAVLRRLALHSAIRLVAPDPPVVVVSNPITSLPRSRRRVRVLYVTDDWIAGAPLMAMPQRLIERTMRRNARRADAVAVVSPPLLALVHDDQRSPTRREIVLPNGAPITSQPAAEPVREPIAGLVGQLNERLDISLLEAVVAAGVPLRIVGPDVTRDPRVRTRLGALLRHPLVDWVGPVPASAVKNHLAEIAVGLTPYVSTKFNRASSPLKTLEYLASGVPVVSSDLPAAAWLDSDDVAIAGDAENFVRHVAQFVADRGDIDRTRARRAFARRNGWDARAAEMLALVDVTVAQHHSEAQG